MAEFFKELKKQNLIDEWGEILDWLLSEERFLSSKGWDKHVGDFTRRVKNSKKCPYIEWKIKKARDIDWKKDSKEKFIVLMQKTNKKEKSQARNLIRHIRNGIAHGNAEIKSNGVRNMIEIKDYWVTKKAKKQTAFMRFPLKYISEWYSLYMEIEKELENKKLKDSSKDSKANKKAS